MLTKFALHHTTYQFIYPVYGDSKIKSCFFKDKTFATSGLTRVDTHMLTAEECQESCKGEDDIKDILFICNMFLRHQTTAAEQNSYFNKEIIGRKYIPFAKFDLDITYPGHYMSMNFYCTSIVTPTLKHKTFQNKSNRCMKVVWAHDANTKSITTK